MKWPRWTRLAALPSLAVETTAPPSAAGLCGKLPGSADFVRALPIDSAATALDAWLVEAVAQLGTSDLQQALGSVSFCFCVPARARALLGVLEPSRDSRGRAFPVAVFIDCGLGMWRAQPASVWQAAQAFRSAARAALPNLGAATAAELEHVLGELPLLAASPEDSGFSQAREFLQTALGAVAADAMFYALQALAAACADPAATGSLVLDCPLRDGEDVARWLVLAGELSAHTHRAWSAFHVANQARLFLIRGEPLPELLRLSTEAHLEHPRVWPLTTNDQLALARARAQLAGVLPELLAPATALDLSTLGNRLARHFSPQ